MFDESPDTFPLITFFNSLIIAPICNELQTRGRNETENTKTNQMHTFFHHCVSFLSDSLDTGLMTNDFGLQGLVLLQEVLDTDQIFAFKNNKQKSVRRHKQVVSPD